MKSVGIIAAILGMPLLLAGCDQQPTQATAAGKRSPGAPAARPSTQSGRASASQSPNTDEPSVPSSGDAESAVMAIILLRDTPANLTPDTAKAIIRKEFGDSAAASMEEGGKPGLIRGYMFDVGGVIAVVNDCRSTYVPPNAVADAARDITNAEAREGFLRHKAWVSVDFMLYDKSLLPKGTTPDVLLDRLGRMAAQLRDDSCVAAYSTMHNEYIPAGAATAEKLRAGYIVDLFPRVTGVAKGDAGMGNAMDEARRRFPEFVAAWNRSKTDGLFLVKGRFTQEGHAEHMWIKVQSMTGTRISGELGNQPTHITTMRKGDLVEIGTDQVSDWAYGTKEGAEGAFTDASLRNVLKGRK